LPLNKKMCPRTRKRKCERKKIDPFKTERPPVNLKLRR